MIKYLATNEDFELHLQCYIISKKKLASDVTIKIDGEPIQQGYQR